MDLFPRALMHLKSAMFISGLNSPKVSSKTALTRCENELETSKLDSWIVFDALYTFSRTSFSRCLLASRPSVTMRADNSRKKRSTRRDVETMIIDEGKQKHGQKEI